MEQILFWRIIDPITKTKIPYGEFSNFARYPFTVDGIRYATSEHYYQSCKFLDKENQQAVINASDAKAAATIGRDPNRPLRPDWEEVKDDIMREAVWHKFISYPGLILTLIHTNNAELIEDSPIDWYWGWGKDHTGKNMLGKILMETRDKLLKLGYTPDSFKGVEYKLTPLIK